MIGVAGGPVYRPAFLEPNSWPPTPQKALAATMCYKRPFAAAFDADAHFANVTGWCELPILFAIDRPNARNAPPIRKELTMVFRRTAALLLAAAWSTSLQAAPVGGLAAVHDPALIVRIQPIERLLADAKHVTGRIGGAAAIHRLEASIAELCGPQGVAGCGIDFRKPIGLYGIVRAEIAASTLVAMIPVMDEKAFLALLERYEIKSERLADHLYSLAIDDLPVPLFLRFAHGYAYFAPQHRTAVELDQLIAPDRFFVGEESGLASIAVRFDRVPESVRRLATLQLGGIASQVVDDEGDGLEDKLLIAQNSAIVRWAKQLLNDAKEVSLRLSYDRKSGEMSIDLNGRARDNSPLAKVVAAERSPQSLFTRFIHDDAAANVLFAHAITEEHRQFLGRLFGADVDQVVAGMEVQDESRAAVKSLVKSLAPTVEQGVLDFAVSLRGPVRGKYGMIAGLRIRDGRKIEAAFREVLKTLPEDSLKNLNWDVGKSDDIAIHCYTILDDEVDETVKKFFGAQRFYFAFRDDAVLVAFGEGGRQVLEESLKAVQLLPSPVACINFSHGRIAKLFEAIDEDAPTWLARVVGEGIDRVRLIHATTAGGDSFQARFSFNLQILVGMSLALEMDCEDFVPPIPAPLQPPAGNPPPLPLPPAPPAPQPMPMPPPGLNLK